MNLYQKLQNRPFLIAGPCVIESEELLDEVAQAMQDWQRRFPHWQFVFKASFDKANRSSLKSFRGPGIERGLELLAEVKEKYQLAVLSDIHEPWQAEPAARVLDILQIPAFLCRQTDLLLAAAATDAIINVKKAQFLSAEDMRYVLQKLEEGGTKKLLLTERGTMFGYNNLVVDYRGLLCMQGYGYPTIMDATHSVQKPGAAGGKSGGEAQYAPFLAQAAAAVGTKGFFIETHPQPTKALSDGPNMIALEQMPKLIQRLDRIIEALEAESA